MDLPSFTPDRVSDTGRARRAAAAFASLDLPSERDEWWRYTDLSKLDLSGLRPVPGRVEVAGAEAEDYGEGAGLVNPAEDVFTAMTGAFGGGVTLRIPATRTPAVVRATLHCDDATAAHLSALHIATEPGAEATVVVRHSGSAGLSAPVIEVEVADDSRLSLVDVQDLGGETVHVAMTRARLGRVSTLRSMVVGLGGSLNRNRTEVQLADHGAEAELLGAYFGERRQHFDYRTLQEHVAPRCRSEVLYQGAVADEARAVYSGLIYVGPNGVKTDATETNRNLVLNKGAWAESIPKLEILQNDLVRCAHASAVGPVDEEQQYYLESRGLHPDVARRLIVMGFFEAVLRRLPDPSVEAGVRLAVVDKFVRAAAVTC